MKIASTHEPSHAGIEREVFFFFIWTHVPFACHPPTYFAINSRNTQRWWCGDSCVPFFLLFFLFLFFPAFLSTCISSRSQLGSPGWLWSSRGHSCEGAKEEDGRAGRGTWEEGMSRSLQEWINKMSHTALRAGREPQRGTAFTACQWLRSMQCSRVWRVIPKQIPEDNYSCIKNIKPLPAIHAIFHWQDISIVFLIIIFSL